VLQHPQFLGVQNRWQWKNYYVLYNNNETRLSWNSPFDVSFFWHSSLNLSENILGSASVSQLDDYRSVMGLRFGTAPGSALALMRPWCKRSYSVVKCAKLIFLATDLRGYQLIGVFQRILNEKGREGERK